MNKKENQEEVEFFNARMIRLINSVNKTKGLIEKFGNRIKQNSLNKDDFKLKVTKDTEEERLVTGIAYAPNFIDYHGDFMTAPEIKKMQERFMRLYKQGQSFIDNMHDFMPGAGEIVESWIVRESDPLFPDERYIGAWALTVKIQDDFVWKDIKEGILNSFSIAGMIEIGRQFEVELDENPDDYLDRINNSKHKVKKVDTSKIKKELVEKRDCSSIEESVQIIIDFVKGLLQPDFTLQDFESMSSTLWMLMDYAGTWECLSGEERESFDTRIFEEVFIPLISDQSDEEIEEMKALFFNAREKETIEDEEIIDGENQDGDSEEIAEDNEQIEEEFDGEDYEDHQTCVETCFEYYSDDIEDPEQLKDTCTRECEHLAQKIKALHGKKEKILKELYIRYEVYRKCGKCNSMKKLLQRKIAYYEGVEVNDFFDKDGFYQLEKDYEEENKCLDEEKKRLIDSSKKLYEVIIENDVKQNVELSFDECVELNLIDLVSSVEISRCLSKEEIKDLIIQPTCEKFKDKLTEIIEEKNELVDEEKANMIEQEIENAISLIDDGKIKDINECIELVNDKIIENKSFNDLNEVVQSICEKAFTKLEMKLKALEKNEDDDENKNVIIASEMINARILAVSIVDQGANLEPTFPSIKQKDQLIKISKELIDENKTSEGEIDMTKEELEQIINNSLNTISERIDKLEQSSNNSEVVEEIKNLVKQLEESKEKSKDIEDVKEALLELTTIVSGITKFSNLPAGSIPSQDLGTGKGKERVSFSNLLPSRRSVEE